MKKIVLFLILILGIIAFWGIKNNLLLINPKSEKIIINRNKKKLNQIGFLPSWMVGKTRLYGEEVDKIIFLGIEVDNQGNLIWDYQAKKINNESYLEQKELTTRKGGDNILGIKLFKDEELDKLLKNSEAVDNLIRQVKEVVKESSFDGVNIDFEYQNNPRAILSQDFFNFLKKIKEAELGEISVDVFVNTVNKGEVEELEKLISQIDYLIIMAYDFHRPGVDYVGPVAPIEAPLGKRSILEVVKNITDIGLEKEKIVLAYPLYGYEWKTYSEDFGAKIKRGWYQMSSWKRSKELVEDNKLEEKWDDLSMSPWLSFKEKGEIHQIYYENERSLEIKVKLARENKFNGVGFWALGYEGKDNIFDY